jgi:AcrR family transcriptional regulator
VPTVIPDNSGLRLGANERRTQLLAAARVTFGTHGFSATSMNDVALTAGVTKPVLYQHFESKHHLFLELLTDTSSQLIDRIDHAVSSASSGREKVEAGFAAYIDFFTSDPHNFRIIYGEGVRSDPTFLRELRAIQSSFGTFTAEHIDIEGLDRESRLTAAQAIAGLLESAVRHWLESEHTHSADELAALLSSLAWRGLRGTATS